MLGHSHEHSLRIGRYSKSGHLYLLTCAVRDRQAVFANFHMGRIVVREMRRLHDCGVVRSLAWVVMPDHLHWLMELRSGSLATLMQSLKGRSAFEINKTYGSGALAWQKGYHDRAVRGEDDLLKMARYVIANPIRAGLVERVGDYSLWDAAWLM